jgi:hypothetical protein
MSQTEGGGSLREFIPNCAPRGSVSALNIIAADVQLCFKEHPRFQGLQSLVSTVLQAYLNMAPDIQYRTSFYGKLI